jgi:hypothetical protein
MFQPHWPIFINNSTFEVMFEAETLMKFAPASVATAFAISVFPVPGGPNSSTPLHV